MIQDIVVIFVFIKFLIYRSCRHENANAVKCVLTLFMPFVGEVVAEVKGCAKKLSSA